MCGIAGVFRRDGAPVDMGLLRRMTDILAHRGPDGDGFHVEGPVGLGHRRLAIIDLSTGDQPMASADGSAWIIYNGEIYNYRELRQELIARGFTFRTTSDTEVVLTAYLAWGPECVRRLRGMFAFAIWDERARRLFLARDRVGIKPLVYAWDGRTLRFASELKAILEDPAVPRELDWEAVRDYFTYHYIPAPRTIFQGIRKLPPASYLVCSLDGSEPEITTYWDLHMVPESRSSETEWALELDHLLHEAVRLHMVSDVPVGAFLSGGIDSSSVVACMARASSTPVKTFSIGFDDQDFDELRYARLVAARHGTEHFEMVLKPDVMSVLPRLSWQLDEPFADASAVPTYCVSKITRDHVTVALSGDGGDESFAGYRRYAEAVRMHERMDRGPLTWVKPLLRWAGARRAPGARGREFLQAAGLPAIDRYIRMLTYQTPEALGGLLTEEAAGRVDLGAPLRALRAVAAGSGSEDYVSTLQYLDVHHYLPEDILAKVDRTSMLSSLESRVPLLDHVVMEHAARMPSGLKLRDGHGKHILKEAMRAHLPAEILTRPKMGFGVPLAGWFRGELRDFARDVLTDPRARQRGIVRPEAVARLLETHLEGSRDHSARLWALMSFELWCRNWWDR
ncbi:MAG: asparagine synthase (glutamine-hydrolyzing) [Candidatus Rokuibacteriota bacterium]